jgi:hypothetical protein
LAISGDYPTPVTVNGYSCKNCTDVDYAKKHIDPAHPRSGPYGVNAKDDPTVKQPAAVVFGGGLSSLNATTSSDTSSETSSNGSQNSASGTQLDISA